MEKRQSKILIVDDKPSNLRFLSKILTERGYNVQRAISGQLALNGVMDAPPDLILLDIIMPQMDGYEVCKRLKATPETRDIPIIFLSALHEILDKVKAFEVGGIDYITKPFQVEEVLARIEKQLTIQRLSKQLQDQNERLQQEIEIRKRTEEILQQSQLLLASVLNSSLDAVAAMSALRNSQGQIIDFKWLLLNPAAEKMLGRKANEVIGKQLLREIPQLHKTGIFEKYVCVVETGEPLETELYYEYGNISIWLQIAAVKLDDGFAVTCRDITERKQAEETLKQQKELLQTIFDHIPVMVSSYDRTGQIQFCNREFERVLGWSQAQLKKYDILSECYPNPDDRYSVLGAMLAATGKWQDFKTRTRSGHILDTCWASIRLRDGRQIGIGQDITERKRAEEALLHSEARFRAIFEKAAIAIGLTNAEGRVIQVNPIFEDFLGYSAAEMCSPNFPNVTHPEDAPIDRELTQELIDGVRDSFQMEKRYIRKDGQVFWGRATISAVRDRDGQLQFTVGMLEDINDIKVREFALQESERRFRAIFNNTFQFTGLLTPDGTLIEANQTALDFAGIEQADVMGVPFWETRWWTISQETQQQLREAIASAARGEFIRYEVDVLGAGDTVATIDFSLKPVFDETDKVVLLIPEGRDITERKQAELEVAKATTALERQNQQLQAEIQVRQKAEEQLRASQQRLSFLVQHAPLAVIEWNANREVVTWNQSAEKIFGYSASEAIGKRAQLLVPESAKTHVAQVYEQLFAQQGGSYSTNENLTKDGRIIICEWYNAPLIDECGSVIGVASIAMDITERQQAKATLQQALEAAETANRAKSNFLASMSHELRTPLNAILGFSQILTRDLSLTLEQQDYLGIINRSGEHLLTLINDVLSMSKIEAGRVALNESSFDLYWLLDSLEEMLQLKALSKGLQLTVERQADIPQHVKTDESKLRQVLINLLGNAIKFTRKGSVTLRVRGGEGERVSPLTQATQADWKTTFSPAHPLTPGLRPATLTPVHTLIFEVEDTGPGIAPEELDSLFDPFVQTQTGRQSMEGTGLGLPISRQFVRLMGGDITVSSTVGKGSIFAFTIKVSLVTMENADPKASQQRVIGLEPNQPKYRILVVEDVAENRKLLVKLFEPVGFEVREAVNGAEAVAVWQSWQPHLILMDIRMPVMDGYEAAQQIKQAPNGQATVIIALTASAFEEQREAILRAGCDDFISKPLREDILWAKIGDRLGVRYIYEDNLPLTTSQKSAQPSALTVEALEVMPQEWVQQLRQAVLYLDDRLIIELIGQIPENHSSLANTLTYLVDNFRLDLILDCIGEH